MNLNQIVALWARDGRPEQTFKQRQIFKGKLGGIASGEARLALSADKREQAKALKNEGLNVSEIAKILQVTRPTVYSWIAQN